MAITGPFVHKNTGVDLIKKRSKDASDAQLLVPYTCGWGGTPMGRWPTIRRSLGPPAGASLYLEHFCPFAGICGGSLAYLVSRAVRIHAPDIVKGQVTGD